MQLLSVAMRILALRKVSVLAAESELALLLVGRLQAFLLAETLVVLLLPLEKVLGQGLLLRVGLEGVKLGSFLVDLEVFIVLKSVILLLIILVNFFMVEALIVTEAVETLCVAVELIELYGPVLAVPVAVRIVIDALGLVEAT